MDIDTLRKVFLRCFIYGIILLSLSFVIYLFLGNWIYKIHGNLFMISRHDINVMYYNLFAFTKMFIFLLFLIPYIALTLTRKDK